MQIRNLEPAARKGGHLNRLVSFPFEINTGEVFMNHIVKVCINHGDLIEDQVYFSKNKKQCKLCSETYRNNPINKETKNRKTAEYIKIDKQKNPEKYKERQRKYQEKFREIITMKTIARNRGITLDEYKDILVTYGDKCGICKNTETRVASNGKIARLSLDHCHKTSKVRGLLCHQCNILIGSAKDKISILANAILYLRRHSNE